MRGSVINKCENFVNQDLNGSVTHHFAQMNLSRMCLFHLLETKKALLQLAGDVSERPRIRLQHVRMLKFGIHIKNERLYFD